MTNRTRQYLGVLAAIAAYYLVHEGAHFLCAIRMGTFKSVHFMGFGMQIEIYEGAKEMLLVDEVDNKEFLTKLFEAMYDDLPLPKPRRRKET